jgi:predicted TIM-barrel fold metal-dependent hydrolase
MSPLHQPAIDCHCHVIDPARFPYRSDTPYQPVGHEIAPVDHLIRMLDLNGVRHALIVGTNSGYGEDSSPVLDAIAHGEGRFKGVAVVGNDISFAGLARLKALGVVGVAFNATFHGVDYYAQTHDLLRRLADLDMFLQVQVRDDQLIGILPLIEHCPVRLVVDHCGRPKPSLGLDQPGFSALLALGRSQRASVKLSGFSQFSHERYPYADTHPFIHALLDAFGSEACVWGSDWPFLRAPERMDYAPLLQLMTTLIPAETAETILWDTPRRLFGFGAA